VAVASWQQVKLINKTKFLEEIYRTVDGDKMDAGIDFLRALENLIHVQVLLGGIHNFEDDAPLPREPDAALANGLLQFSSCLRGIEALARRNPVGRRYSHESPS
jgi:hypothetical protein